MGLIGTVIEFIREQVEGEQVVHVKFDPGGEDTATADHFTPPGVDAQPLPDDYMGLAPGAGTGRWVVMGYLDPINEGTAAPGETRLYSRDSDGNILVTLRMAADEEFVHLGEDVAAALIARADRVEAELDKVKDVLEKHDHVFVADGADSPTDPTLTKYERGDVGCDKVKGT